MKPETAAWLARARRPAASARSNTLSEICMIHLTMTPQTSVIRAYDQPGGYESRLPYLAIVTVTHLTDKIVYLQCAVGKVEGETWKKTLDLLRSKGVATLMMERHGKMKTIQLQAPGAEQPTES